MFLFKFHLNLKNRGKKNAKTLTSWHLAPGSQSPGSTVTLSFESHDTEWSSGVRVFQCSSEVAQEKQLPLASWYTREHSSHFEFQGLPVS